MASSRINSLLLITLVLCCDGLLGEPTYAQSCCDPTDEFICTQDGGVWNSVLCTCRNMTPIIVDVDGNGLSLTDAPRGVQFDLNADGQPEKTAWTAPDSDDAFLALDMNGNGTIDNGAELFGNATPQSGSGLRNGFNALADYDTPAKGGNSDGQIDKQDSIFERLRLWKDLNHNGISEAGELYKLPELGVISISLTYHRTGESDRFGNRLRYRARVNQGLGSGSSRWAIDVRLAGL